MHSYRLDGVLRINNSEIFLLFLKENIVVTCSLELSQSDGSNDDNNIPSMCF